MSLDGKISTGDIDGRDVDADFPRISGLKDGLHQYYDLEKTTDLHSLITGRTLAKIGINKPQKIKKLPVSFIVFDNTHLTLQGIKNMLAKSKNLFIVTSNKKHVACKMNEAALHVLHYKKTGVARVFYALHKKYGVSRITVQSGGTLNAVLLRQKLINCVSIVIAPCLIGGKNTATLVDGDSLRTLKDLNKITTLKLRTVTQLQHSYLHLVYDVQ